MPQLPFKQVLLANENGELKLDDIYTLPFSATLRELTVRISDKCSSRLHLSTFQIFKGIDSIVDLDAQQIIDCLSYVFPKKDLTLVKSEYRAVVLSNGFDPGEKVTIEGVLRFSFGFNVAELDDFEEQQLRFP
jgi:hypothetical protein